MLFSSADIIIYQPEVLQIHCTTTLRLDASGCIDVPVKLGSLRYNGQRQKLLNQFIALSLRHEIGRRNYYIRQEFKPCQIIGVIVIIVVLVLSRLIVFNVKVAVVENATIIADCVSGNPDDILLL